MAIQLVIEEFPVSFVLLHLYLEERLFSFEVKRLTKENVSHPLVTSWSPTLIFGRIVDQWLTI